MCERVLNANLDEINGDNPDDVARAIGNKVVWFDDSIDLTPQLEGNYASFPLPAAANKRPSLAAESNEGLPDRTDRTACDSTARSQRPAGYRYQVK
jgi:hypothetical protein